MSSSDSLSNLASAIAALPALPPRDYSLALDDPRRYLYTAEEMHAYALLAMIEMPDMSGAKRLAKEAAQRFGECQAIARKERESDRRGTGTMPPLDLGTLREHDDRRQTTAEPQVGQLVAALTDDQRLELFGNYCRGCARRLQFDSERLSCHCQNDD